MFSNVKDSLKKSEEEYLRFWEDVCNIESPTDCKEGVDEVGRYFARRAEARGWLVEKYCESACGDVITITMNAEVDAAPVVFSGHMDTVHPKGLFGYPPVKIEDGKIYGPGVCDCKGGIVASFMAMAALEDCGFKGRPIKLILQADEEVSSLYSQKRTVRYMAERSMGAVAFLNTEPCKGGKLTIARKGIIRYIFDIEGKAVHSSLCFAGASAITEAAHKIIELEKWKNGDGITCNCGVISGGTVANTVPQKCTFLADVRFANDEQLCEVERRVREIAEHSYVEGTRCTLTERSRRISMPRKADNLRLAEKVTKALSLAGLPEMEFVGSKGGSDASDMSSYGISTVDSFGVRGAYIHSPLEYSFVESLYESAAMLAAVAYFI